MMNRSTVACLALILLVFLSECSPAKTEDSAPSSVGRKLLTIVDLILAKHIDPPVRQQMILAGVKVLRPSDQGQAKHISKLTTDDEIIQYLDGLFIAFEEAERSEQESNFMRGVFKVLPGGGSVTTAKVAEVEEQLAANRYVGLGIAVSMTNSEFSILSVVPGGAADKSGIQEKDRIVEIDGVPTAGKTPDKLIGELRGEEGSSVTLTISRYSEVPRKIVVQRRVTFIATIKGRDKGGKTSYLMENQPNMGYIKILRLAPSTAHEIKTVEMELREQQIQGLILHLQQATGQVHDVALLADLFLEQGTIAKVRRLENAESFIAQPGTIFGNIPIVVVIDSPTAASSMFALALQENGRANVFGSLGELFVNGSTVLPGGDHITFATGLLETPHLQLSGVKLPVYSSAFGSPYNNDLNSAITTMKQLIRSNQAASTQLP